jgi:hypothetical protein
MTRTGPVSRLRRRSPGGYRPGWRPRSVSAAMTPSSAPVSGSRSRSLAAPTPMLCCAMPTPPCTRPRRRDARNLSSSTARCRRSSTVGCRPKMADLGVELSIDDFGTGYSSLAYLRQIPARTLKMDRSFVGDVDEDEASAAIVGAIVTMGHALGLKIVAEGVERSSQASRLRELGCDAAQGYFFARHLPAREITRYFDSDLRSERHIAPTHRRPGPNKVTGVWDLAIPTGISRGRRTRGRRGRRPRAGRSSGRRRSAPPGRTAGCRAGGGPSQTRSRRR